jgi:hypothetical protein
MGCGCSSNCNNCGQSPCQCVGTTGLRPAPAPYYNQAGQSQETHCQSIVQQFFATAIASSADFVMPGCNNLGILKFPNVTQVQIGSYLWNNIVGYLLVTAFDYGTQEVTVKNECLIGNIPPGSVIPKCSIFNVVDSPYGINSSNSTITASGADLASATPIFTRVSFINGSDGNKGVRLPQNPVGGQEFIIHNTVNAVLKLYPGEAADSLNGVSGGTAKLISGYGSALVHSVDNTAWWAGLMT